MTAFGGTNSGGTGESTSESTEEGGANNETTGAESASVSAGGTAVFNNDTDYVQSGFTQGSQSTSTPITNSNILWGAAATAMLGATLADWQRKREEEEARKRAEAAVQEGGGRSGKKTPGQRAYEKMMKQKRIVGESQALLNEKEPVYIPSQKLEDEETNWLNTLNPVYQYEKRKAELQKKAELQAGLSAYYEGRKKGEVETEPVVPLAPTASATLIASLTPTVSKTPTLWAQTPTSVPATNTPPASPTVVPTPIAIANNIASQPQREKIWWLPSSVEKATKDLLGTLPDTEMVSHRQETPVFGFMASNGMLSFGHVTEVSMGTKTSSFQKGNVNVEVTPEGGRIVTSGNPSLFTELTPNGTGLGVKVNSPVKVEEKGYSGNLGYSAQMNLDWAGNGVVDSIWNSTLTFDLNHVDVDISTGTEGVTQGNITDGVYVKFKPAQVITVAAVVVPLIIYAPQILGAISVAISGLQEAAFFKVGTFSIINWALFNL